MKFDVDIMILTIAQSFASIWDQQKGKGSAKTVACRDILSAFAITTVAGAAAHLN